MNEGCRKNLFDLIEAIKVKCDSLVRIDNGSVVIMDPNDKKVIEGHYAASHAAVAYLLYGHYFNNSEATKKAFDLVTGIINRWSSIKAEPDFHADFNLFALCLFVKRVGVDEESECIDKIKRIVFETNDSPHNTVNWLPMRAYVNQIRYEWSGKKEYLEKTNSILGLINQATFQDYFIDDRLPVGISFNTQYDIATVAAMNLVSTDKGKIDIRPYVDTIKKLVLPDGDINYLGRGCNQIFAWGPWVYLLSYTNDSEYLSASITYLKEKLPTSINNNNMLLNDFVGEERWLWWDYHHFSVYLGHIFMWLMLAVETNDEITEKYSMQLQNCKTSGVDITTSEQFKIVGFQGRKEYLAERGPAIYALWTKKHGVVFKGLFAPWYGTFGNKYSNQFVAMCNYFGLMDTQHEKSFANNRLTRKLGIIEQCNPWLKISPVFSKYTINHSDNSLDITLDNSSGKTVFLNFPLMDSNAVSDICIYADGTEIPLRQCMTINNQYAQCSIFQTSICNAKKWLVRILF